MKYGLLIGLLLLVAIAVDSKTFVPVKCISKIEFTKKCKQLQDGKLYCDGVIITASCVSVTTNPEDSKFLVCHPNP
jgi:hypothetical protein